jgi:Delta-aminolevulinic acid dehydratase
MDQTAEQHKQLHATCERQCQNKAGANGFAVHLNFAVLASLLSVLVGIPRAVVMTKLLSVLVGLSCAAGACSRASSHINFDMASVPACVHALQLTLCAPVSLHAGANAFVQPAALPQSTASAAVHSRTVPSMVATPERVVVQSTAPFDPVGGSNAPLKVNNQGNVWVPQRARPRRNRKSEAMRSMVRETIVTPANFIYPLFIHEEVNY